MTNISKNSNDILVIENLTKIYHTKDGETLALKDLNLTIKEGEFVAIVGPSGCGKSTLLSILCNLEQKTSGNITFPKKDLKLGYMLQEDTLFPWLNILDNSMLGLKVQKKITKANKEKVLNLLDIYGLKDFIKKYPNNLSGGMRQRVALIRTLAIDPDILLLDEAFSALDYQTRLMVSDDVWKIIKKEKKTTIMITHDIAEAISMADRIIVLTNRPAKVKSIYTIEMDNKGSPINNRRNPEFTKYYDLIWKDIDHHV